MQTQTVEITDAAWVNITQGSHTAFFDIVAAKTVLVHINSGAVPDIDGPAFEVLSYPGGYDFLISGLPSSQVVWARAKSGTVDITVATS